MTQDLLRIATRKSPLALWQAEHVAGRLRAAHPGLTVELVCMTTRGDIILDSPLAKVGGKGLFVKELEQGLYSGQADIAVHSMKDVPMVLPPGMALPVMLAREDPRDAFVSPQFAHPDELPPSARVGTCSLRRQAQLVARYPHLRILHLRGNVNTRLAKLDAGDFDAIILAAAGLKRLGFERRIRCCLDTDLSLPAVGQGVIGLECRADDERVLRCIEVLDDPQTHARVCAERAFSACLQGSCQVPIAGFAEWRGTELYLRGRVGKPDGSELLAADIQGPGEQAEMLGQRLGERLLQLGADRILTDLLAQAGGAE